MTEPLWTDQRINDAWEECRQDERMNGPVWEMRDEYEAERTQLAEVNAAQAARIAELEVGNARHEELHKLRLATVVKLNRKVAELEAQRPRHPAKVRVLIDGVGFKAGDILRVYSFDMFPNGYGIYKLWVPFGNGMDRCVGVDAEDCEPVLDEGVTVNG